MTISTNSKQLNWLSENEVDGTLCDQDYICDVFSLADATSEIPINICFGNHLRLDDECQKRVYDLEGDYVLLHLSDERFEHDTDYYARAKVVFRTYFDPSKSSRGVYTLPVGYVDGFRSKLETDEKWFNKKCIWSFFGAIKSDRQRMLNAFRPIGNGFEHIVKGWMTDDALSPERVGQQYRSTAFVPCSMGNISPDCYRAMEALEHGAIPVFIKFYGIDYFKFIYGDHPLVTCDSWPEAANHVAAIMNDPKKLKAKQIEVRDWYGTFKADLRHDINAIISGNPQAVRGRQFQYQSEANQSRKIRSIFWWHFVARPKLLKLGRLFRPLTARLGF